MKIVFEKDRGLVPAIVQDATTGEILMVGYMNEEAWAATVATGFVTFYSRTRQKLWLKGETSGHKLVVREIFTDCDQDAIVVKADPIGPGVCHEGYVSCFFRKLEGGAWQVVGQKAFDSEAVYK